MLVNEQHVVLEAGVQVRFESKLYNDRIVVTVDVGVHTVEPLEELTGESWECLGEWYACKSLAAI